MPKMTWQPSSSSCQLVRPLTDPAGGRPGEGGGQGGRPVGGCDGCTEEVPALNWHGCNERGAPCSLHAGRRIGGGRRQWRQRRRWRWRRRRAPRTLRAHWHEHRGLAHVVRQSHARRSGPATLSQHLELEGGGAARGEGARGGRRPGGRHGGWLLLSANAVPNCRRQKGMADPAEMPDVWQCVAGQYQAQIIQRSAHMCDPNPPF